jgi:biopolymer transport protein ExbD
MAPMIDIIFLLLIFFLVAAKWRPREEFLPIRVSAAGAEEHSPGKPEPLQIYISAIQSGCQVKIGQFASIKMKNEKIESDLAAMMVKIEQCLIKQKRLAADPVEIVCDSKVKWEHLAKIYNIFFGAGLTDITFRMTEHYN